MLSSTPSEKYSSTKIHRGPASRASGFGRVGFLLASLALGFSLQAAEPLPANGSGLRVSARTFEVSPPVGSATSSRTGQTILKTLGTLKTTVVLLQSGN